MLSLNQYFIKEHVGLLKFTNTYDIFDPKTGVKVGVAKEKVSGLIHVLRFLVNKQLLPTRVDIMEDPNDKGEGKVIISIKRELVFLRSKVSVLADGDHVIGYFKSKMFSFGGGFWLYDTNNEKIGEVKGDWKGWNFKLLDITGIEIGTVTKKWSGLGKELFTSADNYMISITNPSKNDTSSKALLLAAGIAIDTIYKEK